MASSGVINFPHYMAMIGSQGDKPRVSVLTPTWNRSAYLERVWNGLTCQTFKNFEWIISNDGSDDDTEAVVRALAAKSKFSVTLISASVHIGKARMDNEAVAYARGEFILWNDSDDYLLPHAIESLVQRWDLIPESDQSQFLGVAALCAAEDGSILSAQPKEGDFETSLNDLAEKYELTGDMLHLSQASAIKACPFPEVDLVVPEGVTWTTLGNRKIIFLSEVLKIKEYRAANAISFSGKQAYCRGRAYAMATSERNLCIYPRSLKTRVWRLITFIRCSVHGEIGPKAQLRLWGDNTPKILWALMWPVAWLLACKDCLQGKVRKTHREFLAAKQVVNITCERLQL